MEADIQNGRHDFQLENLTLGGITERFGETGLRRRYSIEVASFSADERDLCMQALDDVTLLFRGNLYKDLPYTSHLLRTSIRLMRDYEIDDSELVIGMLMHDTPEDHPRDTVRLAGFSPPEDLDLQQAAIWALGQRYSLRVGELVGSVTNPTYPATMSEEEKRIAYRDNVAHKIAQSFDTFLFKLSDITDNGVGLLWTDEPEKLPRRALKYYPLFDVFLEQNDQYRDQGVSSDVQHETAKRQMLVGKARCEMILRRYGFL